MAPGVTGMYLMFLPLLPRFMRSFLSTSQQKNRIERISDRNVIREKTHCQPC